MIVASTDKSLNCLMLVKTYQVSIIPLTLLHIFMASSATRRNFPLKIRPTSVCLQLQVTARRMRRTPEGYCKGHNQRDRVMLRAGSLAT